METRNKFRYKNILLFASLQFCGNLVEYFSENTQKLVIYYVMPRTGKEKNMIEIYDKGRLVYKKKLYSPNNIILCYIFLYIHYVSILFKQFISTEHFYVICGHPLFSFFRIFWKIFRKYDFVYFVGDYYPGNNILNTIYRNISQHYHNHTKYRTYLSDRLNRKLNGEIINTRNIKTVMWGVLPYQKKREQPKNFVQLCFIGAIRESHGLDTVFDILKEKRDLKVKVLGTCSPDLFNKYKNKIKQLEIESNVYFPNKFEPDLEKATLDCHIGVAFYTLNQGTYYADPGKVKAYIQLGLPILMTDAAQIAEYIKEFRAGEIVSTNKDSILYAIEKMQKNYILYIKGLSKLSNYFDYRKYYKDRFNFLET